MPLTAINVNLTGKYGAYGLHKFSQENILLVSVSFNKSSKVRRNLSGHVIHLSAFFQIVYKFPYLGSLLRD